MTPAQATMPTPSPSQPTTSTDWSQAPLARTWHSFSILCWSTALVLGWLHPLPGVALGLLGWWAQRKAMPTARRQAPWPPRRAQGVEAG